MPDNHLKALAAQAALDHIQDQLSENTILGIGTGSTANCFIDLLAERGTPLRATVASSSVSAERLHACGIAVLDLNQVDTLQYYVDGADEVTASLAMIKGGGAALTQEKIVAAVAKTFICVADQSKWAAQLGQFPLPVEVVPMARTYVARALAELGGRPVYRESVLTDNGCHILDVHDLDITHPVAMEAQINQITGVLTNGLFAIRPADLLLLSTEAEGVKHLTPKALPTLPSNAQPNIQPSAD